MRIAWYKNQKNILQFWKSNTISNLREMYLVTEW